MAEVIEHEAQVQSPVLQKRKEKQPTKQTNQNNPQAAH
jgi:hypothetical protein